MTVDSAKVKEIIAEVGEFITTLYHNHHSGHVLEEGREAITIADIEGERQLITRLTDLLPGSIGVGEEDIVTRTRGGLALPSFNADDTVWFVDPIDGTRAFKEKRDNFAIMVALQQKGALTHGWIYFPVTGLWIEGEIGTGATINGAPVILAQGLRHHDTEICIDPYHLPLRQCKDDTLRDALLEEESIALGQVETKFRKRWPGQFSCLEIKELLQGETGLLFHANGYVWDNAAGVAIYRAAGGVVRMIGGDEYAIKGPQDIRMEKRGLLYAPSEHDWQQAQQAFAPLRAYLGRQNLI